MFGDKAKQRWEAEQAERSAANEAARQAVDKVTREGFRWRTRGPYEQFDEVLTCDTCGAVVTIQTQERHADWHAQRVTADVIAAAVSRLRDNQ